MSSWFEKCMPRIKDIKPNISTILDSFKKEANIKSLYIWGSYAQNINKPNFRVKDIDIIAKTNFDIGDLLAIDEQIIKNKYSDDYLEDQGYNPNVIKFSKSFINLKKCNIDCWAISSNRKLLHWGPLLSKKSYSESIIKKAEQHAIEITGYSKNNINYISEMNRKNWYNSYCNYINDFFEDMPTGWYKTEDIKIKEIIRQAIKI